MLGLPATTGIWLVLGFWEASNPSNKSASSPEPEPSTFLILSKTVASVTLLKSFSAKILEKLLLVTAKDILLS